VPSRKEPAALAPVAARCRRRAPLVMGRLDAIARSLKIEALLQAMSTKG
jgi:hypothetical protein